jgi:hypothetical protein
MAAIDQLPQQAQQQQVPLESLQDRFAILDLTGNIRLIDRNQVEDYFDGIRQGELSMYTKADANLKMKRHLEAMTVPSDLGKVINDFWNSPNTKEYDALAFSPGETSESTLNFWVGPTPAAARGIWVGLRNYLRDVVCNGDELVFDYLIRYLAHMVQRPDEKPGIMLVLLGGQGTGKGMFFNFLRALWSHTTLQVSAIDQVIGRFNAQIERNFIICMDEALFAGDKKALDRLKSAITEPVIQIEQKHQPSRTIESVHRFLAASNHDQFAHIERDDRRFVFLRLSSKYKQDTTYFGTIVASIADPVTMGAVFYYLSRKDISEFNVRVRPATSENLSQKLKSLEGFERYWYEVLSTGNLAGQANKVDLLRHLDSFPAVWSDSVFVGSEWLLQKFKDFDKNAQRFQTVQIKFVREQLSKLCPSAEDGRQLQPALQGEQPRQIRGIKLPALPLARQEFSAAMGSEVDWGED